MHAMALMAADTQKMYSTKEIAARLKVSEAHLSKVLQRLHKAGLLKSLRGPKGGFALEKRPGEITLLEVYESIDGPMSDGNCLLEPPVCQGATCVLGGLLASVNTEVRNYLSGTRLSDLKDVYQLEGGKTCRE